MKTLLVNIYSCLNYPNYHVTINSLVQRHPDHAVGGTFFWSHHEKFVVVDNHIAFLGGIDLCYG